MSSLVKKITLPVLLFFGFLALYIHNLSRSVYGGDVGDLVTTASLGGVAHPPGYPLFTLLGFMVTHLPFPFFRLYPAFAVGLISSLSASVGIVCLYQITYLLTKNKIVSGIASLTLGLSFLYWFYGEIAEVFALNAFFALMLFLLALLFRKTQKKIILLLFFLFLGFSFTNHQTIILIVPSLIILIGKPIFSLIRKQYSFPFWCLLLFCIGLTPYAYIFVASSYHPILNWDNVHDIPSFFHLILRSDYGTFQAGIFDQLSFNQRLVTLKVYLSYLLFQLTIPVVLLSLVGFWRLFIKEKTVFFSLVLAWVLAGPFFLLYAGFPLTSGFIIGAVERFILLSSVIFFIPFGTGLLYFSEFLAKLLPKRNYATLFQFFFLFIPFSLLIYNFPKTDLSHVFLGDNYAHDFLDTLPQNSVLLISGDTQVFNTWYVHYVLHDRSDILVYNIGATPLQDTLIAPRLVGIPESKRTEKVLHLFQDLQKTRSIFSANEFQVKVGDTITWVPYGLSFKMYLPGDVLPSKDEYETTTRLLWTNIHYPSSTDTKKFALHNLTIVEIPTYYSNNFLAAGTYAYLNYQDSSFALEMYKKAEEIAPNNAKVYSAIGILQTTLGKCVDAANNFTTAISLDQYQELPYMLLYTTYKNCFKNEKAAQSVGQEFTSIFQKDFQKELEKTKTQLSLPTQ